MQRRITAAFAAWAQDRLAEGAAAAFQVEVVPCSAMAASQGRVPVSAARGAHGSFWVDGAQEAAMQALLFGAAARTGSMAADLARSALAELLEAVADAAPRPCAQDVIDPSEPGRALAEATVRCRGQAIALLVELPDTGPRAQPSAGPGPAAASYASALLPHEVRIQATLGAVDVDLGTLHMLRPGDILRLDKRLDDPVELDIAGERLPCDAWLVATGQHKAVELSRPQDPHRKDPSHA